MKKSIIAVALLLVATQANASLFDDAMSFLKKNAASLFEKGKKALTDNSDKIWDLVKEQATPFVGKGIDYAKEQLGTGQVGTVVGKGLDYAKEQLLGKKSTTDTKPAGTKTVDEAAVLVKNEAKKEADKEEQELLTQAQNLVKDKNLTAAEQKMILQEAQALANQNRAALERQAIESIAKKKEALKQSVYAKYGKGTPIVQ